MEQWLNTKTYLKKNHIVTIITVLENFFTWIKLEIRRKIGQSQV